MTLQELLRINLLVKILIRKNMYGHKIEVSTIYWSILIIIGVRTQNQGFTHYVKIWTIRQSLNHFTSKMIANTLFLKNTQTVCTKSWICDFLMNRLLIKYWWKWHQMSVSLTFYEQLLHQCHCTKQITNPNSKCTKDARKINNNKLTTEWNLSI